MTTSKQSSRWLGIARSVGTAQGTPPRSGASGEGCRLRGIVGVVVVEVVFVYPGIGQLMVDAVTARDIPVVQACALIFAVTYIILNLIADVISIITNPRLLHPR